jgi:ABC-2 type transport system permease protein
MSEVAVEPLELREVHGPSAFGASRDRFWDLLWTLSVNEFRNTYAQTALGFLWTLVRPLVFFGVIFLILRQVLRFGSNVPDYGIILVLNLILYTYFQDSTMRGVRSIPNSEPMVRKMRFPRIVIPLSITLTGAFTLLCNLVAVFPLLLLFGLEPELTWLLFPLLLVALTLLTTTTTMLLSALYVPYRDTAQAWTLIARMMFYASPVLFPIELVPESFRKIVAANPLAPILELSRVWIVDPTAPGPIEAAGVVFGVLIPAILFIGICVTGVYLFVRGAPRFGEEL